MDIWAAIDNHNITRIDEILTKDLSLVNAGFSTRFLFRKTEEDKPIHFATRKGFSTVVQKLIHYGADVNSPNHEGKTALHVAADFDFVDLVVLFLDVQVKVNATDSHGLTALHYAANRGYLEILTILLEHEADTNITDSKSRTPLWYAAKRGSLPCAKALLEHEADASQNCLALTKLLHNVTMRGDAYMLSLLLVNNAKINSQDKNGSTALHHAVTTKRVTCVKMLMEKGADSNIKDSTGSSALSLAIAKGSREIIQYFANAGTTSNEISVENAKSIDIIIMKKENEMASINEKSKKIEEEVQRIQIELDNLHQIKGITQHEIDQSKEIVAREEERIAIHSGLLEGLERDERNFDAQINKDNNCIEEHNTKTQNLKDEIKELEKLKQKLLALKGIGSAASKRSDNSSNPIPEEYLECPICCSIPKPPIHVYQCHEGHVYCGECKNKPNMHRCPVCKTDISYSSIRNRYMEARIAEMLNTDQ